MKNKLHVINFNRFKKLSWIFFEDLCNVRKQFRESNAREDVQSLHTRARARLTEVRNN